MIPFVIMCSSRHTPRKMLDINCKNFTLSIQGKQSEKFTEKVPLLAVNVKEFYFCVPHLWYGTCSDVVGVMSGSAASQKNAQKSQFFSPGKTKFLLKLVQIRSERSFLCLLQLICTPKKPNIVVYLVTFFRNKATDVAPTNCGRYLQFVLEANQRCSLSFKNMSGPTSFEELLVFHTIGLARIAV